MDWPGGTITKGYMWCVLLQIMYLVDLICVFLVFAEYNVINMAGAIYCGFAAFVSLVRREIRSQWGIPRGDLITDFMWSLWAPMFVLTQLEIQMAHDKVDEIQKKGQETEAI